MQFKASSLRTKQRLKVEIEKGTHTHTHYGNRKGLFASFQEMAED